MSCSEALIILLTGGCVFGLIVIMLLIVVIKTGMVAKGVALAFRLFWLYGKSALFRSLVRNAPFIYRSLRPAGRRVVSSLRRAYEWLKVRLNP